MGILSVEKEKGLRHFCSKSLIFQRFSGGAGRSRTDLHGFAIRCITALLPRLEGTTPTRSPDKKGKPGLPFGIWSGKRGSNSRPQPWQGCALPAELFPHTSDLLRFRRIV